MHKRGLRLVVLFTGLALQACALPRNSPASHFPLPTAVVIFAGSNSPKATDTAVAPVVPAIEPTFIPAESPTQEPSQPTALPTNQPSATATSNSIFVRPNDAGIAAMRLAAPPVIDGILSEWNSTAYNIDKVVYGTGSWEGIGDASASFHIAWDSSNLYIALRVSDDIFVPAPSGRDLFKGDSIEIQLDANLTDDFYSDTLSSDDYQIGISPGDFSELPPHAYLWFPRNLERTLPSVNIEARQVGSGYEIEASIPWITLGLSPVLGDHFGFVVSISDNDSPGTVVQQTLISHVGTRKLLDPTSWGTIILK